MQIIADQLVFFLALWLLFFVPGRFFVQVLIGKHATLSPLERFVASFGIGIIIMDFTIIFLNKTLDLPLTRTVLLSIPLATLLISALQAIRTSNRNTKNYTAQLRRIFSAHTTTRNRTTTTTAIAALLIILTIAIKTFYIADTIFPTATDMGHHLYWVNKIAQTQELHAYKKQKLVLSADGHYTMTAPDHIPDFIIGEHIPLAALQIVTGADILAPQHVLFLFILDLMSLLAVVMLAMRIFAQTKHATTIGLATLFLMGPLYTISASQAKFVTGGVIGNLFGNLFIPLALFFLYRALHERSARFLTLFVITTAGLLYTHHLSTFILAYVIAFTVSIFIIVNIRTFTRYIADWLRLLITPSVLITLVALALFVSFVHIPAYLNPDAIISATGAPSKATRTGVAIAQLVHTIGQARFTFALLGLAIIALPFILRRLRHTALSALPTTTPGRYAVAFLIAWPLATFAMSTIPQFLGVNIISSRIANYTIIPFALIGGVGLWWLIATTRRVLPQRFALITLFLIFLFPLTSGMYDNSQSLKTAPNVTPAQESFAAARYLAQHAAPDAWTLKDHNYLTADTWMKLFFLRDYSYPLSRSYFKRYEFGTRETCTRDMISTPLAQHAQQCFTDLNVRYIIVNPAQDSAQFMAAPQFNRIYSSDAVTIFSTQ